MNNGLESRIIDFAEGASRFTTDFVEAYKKLQEITQNAPGNVKVAFRERENLSDRQIEARINQLNRAIDRQLENASRDYNEQQAAQAEENPELEDVEGQMNIYDMMDASTLNAEDGVLDRTDNMNKREFFEDLLAYRKAVREATDELDRVIQHMEAKFKEVERYDLLQLADYQLKLNENENSVLARRNSERINSFLRDYKYYQELIGDMRDVLPSRLETEGVDNYTNSGEYNISSQQLDDLYTLIDHGYEAVPSQDRNVDTIRFDGIDQLQMQMESRSEELNRSFSKPRLEFEIVGDEINITFVAGGRKYKYDGAVDLKTTDKEELNRIFRGLTARYVENSTNTKSDLLNMPFELAEINGKDINYIENDSPGLTFDSSSFGYSNVQEKIADIIKQRQNEYEAIHNIDLEETQEEIVEEEPEIEEENNNEVSEEPEIEEENNNEVSEEPEIEEENNNEVEEEPEIEEENNNEVSEEPEIEEENNNEVEEEPEIEEENNNEVENNNGLRVVSSRVFVPRTKVGNDNANLRTEEVEPFYKDLKSNQKTARTIGGLIAGVSLLSFAFTAGAPALVAFGGSIGMATLLNKIPEITKNARMHKLKRLAQKLDCKLALDMDNYKLNIVDQNGEILSNEQVIALGQEKGIDAQAELDVIADNKFRGRKANGEIIEDRNFKNQLKKNLEKKIYNKFARKLDRLAHSMGLKIDTYYLDKTGGILFVEQDSEIYEDDVEFTPEIRAELEERAIRNSSLEYAGLDQEMINKIKEEYRESLDDLKNYDFNSELLRFRGRDARKLRARHDLKEVNFDSLIETFDDLGGIRLASKKKKSKLAQLFSRHRRFNRAFNDEEEVVVDAREDELVDAQEIEPEIEDEPEIEEEVVEEEPVVDEDLAEEVNEPIQPEPIQPDPVQAEPVQVSEEPTRVIGSSEDIDLDYIQNQIINQTVDQIANPQFVPASAVAMDESNNSDQSSNEGTSAETDVQEEVVEAQSQTQEIIEEPVEAPEESVQNAVQEEVQEPMAPEAQKPFVSSDKLISELHEMVDYHPDMVQAYMSQHADAATVLLPELVRTNPALADQFIDNNVAMHPELQAIYDQAVKSKNEGFGLMR